MIEKFLSVLSMLLVLNGIAAAEDRFKDPATPKVVKIADVAPPKLEPHPRVKLHAKPTPLNPKAVTHDWASFLGPTHNGVSSETQLLKEWPKSGPKLLWEMEKGSGYSSPAIVGDHLVFVHRIRDEGIIECLHPVTGQAYWDYRFKTDYQDRYGYNNGPRSSPIVDEGNVYVYSAEGFLFCLKLATGQLVWRRELANEFGVPQDFFGTSTSPLVEGELLIINVGAPKGPCVAAFNKRTGKMVWGAGSKWGPSYASPVPAEIHGQRTVFVFAGGESRPPTGGLLAINPKDGKLLFEFPWRSSSFESVNASCPVVIGNRVYISSNYFLGGAMLNLNKNLKHEVAWTNKDLGTHWNTAVYDDGHLYGFDGHFENDSALLCVNARTGKTMWRESPQWEEVLKLNGVDNELTMSTFRGSLLKVDNQFLCMGEWGHLMWMDLSPKGFEIRSKAWLFVAKEAWCLPVVSKGLVYICQNTPDRINRTPMRLLCYDLRKP